VENHFTFLLSPNRLNH